MYILINSCVLLQPAPLQNGVSLILVCFVPSVVNNYKLCENVFLIQNEKQ